MLANIKPDIAMSQNFEGEKSSNNDAYIKNANTNNIRNTISQIRAKSEILKEMEKRYHTNSRSQLLTSNRQIRVY